MQKWSKWVPIFFHGFVRMSTFLWCWFQELLMTGFLCVNFWIHVVPNWYSVFNVLWNSLCRTFWSNFLHAWYSYMTWIIGHWFGFFLTCHHHFWHIEKNVTICVTFLTLNWCIFVHIAFASFWTWFFACWTFIAWETYTKSLKAIACISDFVWIF